MSVEHLPRRYDYCNKFCPLYNSEHVTNRHVPSEVVQRNAAGGVDIVFVAEAPGEEEDLQLRPLVGRSGAKLRGHLARIGMEGVGYAFLNICRCRPTKLVPNERTTKLEVTNRTPTVKEQQACVRYLWEDLQQLRPSKIVALGGTATKMLLPTLKGGVTDEHGRVHVQKVRGLKRPRTIIPTYHPAAALYDKAVEPYLVEDLTRALNKATKTWNADGKTRALLTLKDVRKFIHRLRHKLTPEHIVSFDVETTTINRVGPNRLLSIAFAYDDVTAYAIPYDHPKAPWTPREFKKLRRMLRRLFIKPNPSFGYWAAHNSSFDQQIIHKELGTFVISRPTLDTMWMFFGYDETRLDIKHPRPFALKQLLIEFLDWNPYDDDMLKLREQGRMDDADLLKLLAYNGTDCYATIRLIAWIKERAGDNYWPKLLRLADKLMAPAQLALNQVELNGFAIDVGLTQKLYSKQSPLLKELEKLKEWFRHYKPARRVNKRLLQQQSRGMPTLFAKREWVFDLRKRTHLLELFIEELGLAPINFGKELWKGKPGPKIDKKFKDAYKDHEAVKKLKQFGEIDKLISSYVKSILTKFLRTNPDCADGRVRSHFWTTRTVTGRLASKNPNLQQIPRKSDEDDTLQAKTQIKNMFCATPGWALVSADFMQGEVYLLGQVSRDANFCALLWRIRKLMEEYEEHPSEALAKQIKNDGDVHRQTAALMFNVDVKDVTKDMRQTAKAIVFGLIYGKAITTLAKDLKISDEEAEKKAKMFFSRFPAAEKWLHKIELFAIKHKFVESELGRRRRFPRVGDRTNPDPREDGKARRRARNSPIQSLLSDIALHAAGRLQQYIWQHKLTWRIVDIVHDAIIAEVPLPEMASYIRVTKRIMTDLTPIEHDFNMEFVVPMNVEFEVGTHYGQLKGLEPGVAGIRAAKQQIRKEWQSYGYRMAA